MHGGDIQMDWDYREDGRLSKELRLVTFETNIEKEARFNGSSRVCQGLTEVVCFIEGPVSKQGFRLESKESVIRLSCSQSPTASFRVKSSSQIEKELGNFLENVRETFEGNILKDVYKNSCIDISLVIIQSHGSLKCAILNAVSLALIDAGIEMKDIVVSCSTGFIPRLPGQTILDLSDSEESNNRGQMILAYSPNKDKLLLIETKNGKLPYQEVLQLMDTATQGCLQIYTQLKIFLKQNYALKLLLSKPS